MDTINEDRKKQYAKKTQYKGKKDQYSENPAVLHGDNPDNGFIPIVRAGLDILDLVAV